MLTTCPIPESKLTKNRPDYERLYSPFEPVRDSPYNDIYSNDNFKQFYHRQADAMVQWTTGMHMFCKDVPNRKNKGSKSYTICSLRAIYGLVITLQETHGYYMVPFHDPMETKNEDLPEISMPSNMFFDLDMSYDEMHPDSMGRKSVNDAMKELMECVDIVVKQEREKGNETFQFSGEYDASVMYGNKPSKQSAHIVLHFTGIRMFKDVNHCRFFYNHIIRVSDVRHPDRNDNPMYIKHIATGEWKCIVDQVVYSRNRAFRLPGCTKLGKTEGKLYPPCGTEKLFCDDKDCQYHVYGRFSFAEFCENCPTFVPRNTHGIPMLVTILTIEESVNVNLKKNQHVISFNNNNNNSSSSVGGLFAMTSRSSLHANVSPVGKSHSMALLLEDSSATYAKRKEIMNLVAQMITRKTGYTTSLLTFKSAEFATFKTDGCKSCVYLAKRMRPEMTKHNVRPMDHQSNHIFYTAHINLPLPHIYINCLSPLCVKFIETLRDKATRDRLNFEIMKLDVSTAPDELLAQYARAVVDYMKACELAPSMFKVTKKSFI